VQVSAICLYLYLYSISVNKSQKKRNLKKKRKESKNHMKSEGKSNKIKSLGRHYVFFSFFLCRRIPAVARKCQSPSGKHSKGLFTSVFGPTNGCNFALWVHYHAGDNVLVRWWRWLCWLTGPGIESWEKWTTWLAAWLPGEIIICLGQSQMGCTWPTCQRLSFGDGRWFTEGYR